jgi:hypothetical protein
LQATTALTEEGSSIASEGAGGPIWLPILAALLGAAAAGLFSHLFTRHRERVKARREKVGLLKLVHVEVTNNLEYLKEMGIVHPPPGKPKRWPDNLKAKGLRSDAWEQSRARLAELVEDAIHFEYLVSCYGSLAVLKDRLLDPGTDTLSREEHENQVQSVRDHHWLASEACRKETKRFRAWSRGMLVSEVSDKPSLLEEKEDTPKPKPTEPDRTSP